MKNFEKPDWHSYIDPTIAEDATMLEQLKKEGRDPVIFQANENEISIYTRNPEVLKRIRDGHAWHSGEDTPDKEGYFHYEYTRLTLAEVKEHLNNPRDPNRGEN